jgi:hypothetical protein
MVGPGIKSSTRSKRWGESGRLVDDIEHPDREKYPGQGMLANGYVYAIPCVSTPDGIFLKTAFPSRRLKAYRLSD